MNTAIAKSLAVVAIFTSLVACTGVIPSLDPPSESNNDRTESAVTPPCPNAELHSSTPYTECRSGRVANLEKDIWCCGNNVMRETNTLVSTTETACGSEVVGGATSAGDSGAPLVACTAAAFSNPTVVAGGVVQFNVIPTPSDCSVTIDPTSWVPATNWNVVGSGSSSVTMKGKSQPDPGSVTYTWTCTCPNGNGTPGTGTETVTFSG
jgi:hypothetical protein